MNSTRNLLGMLSEVHSMEAKFALAIMESTLKLVSLADANIFILVEGEDNRRYYGGKKHLCDAFSNGVLFPEITDAELVSNVDVSSLSPKYPEPMDGMDEMGCAMRPFVPVVHPPRYQDFEEDPSLSYEDPTLISNANSLKESLSPPSSRKRKMKVKKSPSKLPKLDADDAATNNCQVKEELDKTPRKKKNQAGQKWKGCRSRISAVYDFFVEEEGKFRCIVAKEGKPCHCEVAHSKSGGGPSGNLKRHIRRHHPNEFDFVRKKDDEWKQPTINEAINAINQTHLAQTLNDDFSSADLSPENRTLQLSSVDQECIGDG